MFLAILAAGAVLADTFTDHGKIVEVTIDPSGVISNCDVRDTESYVPDVEADCKSLGDPGLLNLLLGGNSLAPYKMVQTRILFDTPAPGPADVGKDKPGRVRRVVFSGELQIAANGDVIRCEPTDMLQGFPEANLCEGATTDAEGAFKPQAASLGIRKATLIMDVIAFHR